MKRILTAYPFIGFALVLIITTSVTLLGLKTLQDRDAADEWVNRSNKVIATADQVLLGMSRMDSGFSGYLLTGHDVFLEPYRAGKTQYDVSIRMLIDLTEDNTSQEERWKQVQVLAEQWQNDWAAPGILVRQKVNAGLAPDDAVLQYMDSDTGRRKMAALQDLLAAGKQEETDLLAGRLQNWQRASELAYGMMVVGMTFAVVLGAGSGIIITRRNERNRQYIELQRLLLEERENERREIARDLHDGPMQEILAANFAIQGAAADAQEPRVAEQLAHIRCSLQKTVADMRAYAMELRSPVLTQFGLEKGIRAYLDLFRPKHPEMAITFAARQTGDLLPVAARNALYRIFQEAINNVVRHSQASEVAIRFERSAEGTLLELRDNGVGFEVPDDWLALARMGHLGLVGMRERAAAMGGEVEIQSHAGQGTTLRVTLPPGRHLMEK